MRFEVPQFIDIEDKIFGPLTWRQFVYLGGGVGMAVALFFVTNLFVFILLGLPLALLAGALAFYPFNGRPFSYFLEALYNYLTNQHLYLWRKQSDSVHHDTATATSNLTLNQAPTTKKKNIASLARKLELQALQKTE